jgi:hypothetical protein
MRVLNLCAEQKDIDITLKKGFKKRDVKTDANNVCFYWETVGYRSSRRTKSPPK